MKFCRNLKYVNTPNTLNTGHFKIFEAKNLKYVNTPNTLNTRHFKIWMKKVKYVNTPNTLNTGHFKILEEKKSNTEYVKYVKYVFSPICHTTSLWWSTLHLYFHTLPWRTIPEKDSGLEIVHSYAVLAYHACTLPLPPPRQ